MQACYGPVWRQLHLRRHAGFQGGGVISDCRQEHVHERIQGTASGEIDAKGDDPFALLVRDGAITTDQEAIARPGRPHPRQPIHGVVQDEAVL